MKIEMRLTNELHFIGRLEAFEDEHLSGGTRDGMSMASFGAYQPFLRCLDLGHPPSAIFNSDLHAVQ